MKTYFDSQAKALYEKANGIINAYLKTANRDPNSKINLPKEFKEELFCLIDKVNLSLMEDKDNFYGYFLLQMIKEIRFNMSSPTAVNFKGATYVIYFNPLIFLKLSIKQMESTIKHEILHILSMHLIRGREYEAGYSRLAINMSMDIVVNAYLDNLPPYATTLEWINLNYSLKLLPFKPFEYYVEELQTAFDLLEEDVEGNVKREVDLDGNGDGGVDVHTGIHADLDWDKVETEYNPIKSHDLWEASCEIEEKTLKEFTEKYVYIAQKGKIPSYLESMVSSLRKDKAQLPWNLYLKKLMGTIESNKKKTITRRNRRQPERLDLRGELRGHKANIVVALDISGSISDEEFNQAMKEVLQIVKNDNHEITLIECDSEIRRVYKVNSIKDLRERMNIRGGTRFSPVFEYANHNKVNLLVYFTDGKGEDELLSIPRGYKTLWVISGTGDQLSVKEPYGAVKKLRAIESKENVLNMSDVMRDGFSMNHQEGNYVGSQAYTDLVSNKTV